MKLYVLRHEERNINDPLPLSPLTKNGFLRSLGLIKKINEINPDIIYCSPFLRTIETIYPYCKFYDKKINIENSLYEYLHAPEFNNLNYLHTIYDLNKNEYQNLLLKCINYNYESDLNIYDINFPESSKDLYKRVQKFLLKIKNKNKNKKILFVTHMSTINAVKSTNLDDNFKMGHIERII